MECKIYKCGYNGSGTCEFGEWEPECPLVKPKQCPQAEQATASCLSALLYSDDKGFKEKYMQLIYAVAQKFPGETRHETALRYITERENKSHECSANKSV